MLHAHRGDGEAARRDLALAEGLGDAGSAPLRAEVEHLLASPGQRPPEEPGAKPRDASGPPAREGGRGRGQGSS
ncbi:hypothetical protein [Streptosporangium carneum]|uniref:Uncharacterized protein n=1 Tax=Streptosporangium carneum TaxID=47481 RepID=A0A9W6IB39_9ACTN|nr:hypothetical protein [Streptosporangium carneum]GLK14913.1 hypothetical protein GCM10017600_83260 [Streptosporangium carneum]